MKRILSAALIFVLVASAAFAATAMLQINSSQKLDTQFEAFRAYLNSLSATDRQAWLDELASITSGSGSSFSTFMQQPAEQMVWIPKTVKKYHKTSTCSNTKNPVQVTITDAINGGYERCSKCKP